MVYISPIPDAWIAHEALMDDFEFELVLTHDGHPAQYGQHDDEQIMSPNDPAAPYLSMSFDNLVRTTAALSGCRTHEDPISDQCLQEVHGVLEVLLPDIQEIYVRV